MNKTFTQQFHHIGLPTDASQPGEVYVADTKVWVTDPRRHPYHVEFLRFEKDSPVKGPVRDLPHPTLATSIGASQGTYQGVAALRASSGRSVFVDDEDILAWQARLARMEGIYAEPSAVATLPAIEKLRAGGVIAKDASVVALLTASGLKDNAATERNLKAAPEIEGDIDAAVRALKENYGFDAEK